MKVTPYANSLFEQPWWLDIVAPGQWKEITVCNKEGAVVARMPYVQEGKRVIMPKLTQTLGFWMSHETKADYGAQKKILYELFGQLSSFYDVSIALSPNNDYVLPLRWLHYEMKPCFSYRLTDLSDCDILYKNFNKTLKKNIKYARNKVRICDKLSPDTLWDMLNKTFQAQNRKNPISRDMVMRILHTCEETGHGKYFEARDAEGNVHSCAYFVYDEQVCYYLFGASDSRFRSSGSQSLVLWEGIQFAASHSKVFDFEGSMIEGIENFFRQFGGVCTPYYVVSRRTFLSQLIEILKPRIKQLLGYKM